MQRIKPARVPRSTELGGFFKRLESKTPEAAFIQVKRRLYVRRVLKVLMISSSFTADAYTYAAAGERSRPTYKASIY